MKTLSNSDYDAIVRLLDRVTAMDKRGRTYSLETMRRAAMLSRKLKKKKQ